MTPEFLAIWICFVTSKVNFQHVFCPRKKTNQKSEIYVFSSMSLLNEALNSLLKPLKIDFFSSAFTINWGIECRNCVLLFSFFIFVLWRGKPQSLNLFVSLAYYPNAVFYFPKHNYIVHFMIQAISKQFAFAYVLQTGEFTIFC